MNDEEKAYLKAMCLTAGIAGIAFVLILVVLAVAAILDGYEKDKA